MIKLMCKYFSLVLNVVTLKISHCSVGRKQKEQRKRKQQEDVRRKEELKGEAKERSLQGMKAAAGRENDIENPGTHGKYCTHHLTQIILNVSSTLSHFNLMYNTLSCLKTTNLFYICHAYSVCM